jgi:hypothetical protein
MRFPSTIPSLDTKGTDVNDSRYRRIVASLIEKIPKDYPSIWYENQEGDRFVPDLTVDFPADQPIPEGFDYHVSRFPNQLSIEHLSMVKEEKVDACEHPEDHIEKDLGIIDSMEGRTCKSCGGYQSKEQGEPWPEKWEAYGSRPLMTMNMGWQEDLALGLVKKGFGLSEAIVVAACACERCMNVLADEVGLDWGYPEGSEDWVKCGTSCGLCDGKEL